MEINNVTIGNRIKELRTSKNLTQEDIAKMVKVSKATISNYEKGKVSPPIELLIKLAERYDVSIDWLCGLSNEEIPRLMSYGDAFFRLVEIDKVIGFSVEDVTFFSNLRGTAVLFDATLTKALEEYQEMVNLRDNNTISEHLFNLWISDKVQQLDKQYRLLSNQTLKNLKKMDKDLEKSIKQKEGETNGNSTKKGSHISNKSILRL